MAGAAPRPAARPPSFDRRGRAFGRRPLRPAAPPRARAAPATFPCPLPRAAGRRGPNPTPDAHTPLLKPGSWRAAAGGRRRAAGPLRSRAPPAATRRAPPPALLTAAARWLCPRPQVAVYRFRRGARPNGDERAHPPSWAGGAAGSAQRLGARAAGRGSRAAGRAARGARRAARGMRRGAGRASNKLDSSPGCTGVCVGRGPAGGRAPAWIWAGGFNVQAWPRGGGWHGVSKAHARVHVAGPAAPRAAKRAALERGGKGWAGRAAHAPFRGRSSGVSAAASARGRRHAPLARRIPLRRAAAAKSTKHRRRRVGQRGARRLVRAGAARERPRPPGRVPRRPAGR
jgi:hypothetical protein